MGATSFLEKLPIELLQAILCWLPDIQSLRSALLAAPFLYAASRDLLVVKSVLLHQLDRSLLHDALAADRAALKTSWTETEPRRRGWCAFMC
ncbi:uncharacterized protein ASPGLDRAFT_44915 [Aspergillus glaucus CBS 516.65]|uniref:F-box domain-containing protein n=1 Tax=Aspergillus glaucus CBS 516.65 TaxID=1160497 RepID=A0A1L9VPX9_ASPGL|nr:hypothetical protein ASPGLDRAFT_44915 [Aspergillus glaucus CBS 516.65]OJJ85944.1 hypothetical protein ASPGLDRAFT_44915 [Aspergillus glaucus CBS 516.65]